MTFAERYAALKVERDHAVRTINRVDADLRTLRAVERLSRLSDEVLRSLIRLAAMDDPEAYAVDHGFTLTPAGMEDIRAIRVVREQPIEVTPLLPFPILTRSP